MATRQINNFKPEDVISWNTDRPYDALGQTISAWRDPELVRKGFTRSKNFSWQKCADQTLKLYKKFK